MLSLGMTRSEVIEHLKTLTEEERYELLDEASAVDDFGSVSSEEIGRRIAEYEAGNADLVDWETFKQNRRPLT